MHLAVKGDETEASAIAFLHEAAAAFLGQLLAAEALAEEACARLLERLLERIERSERKGEPGGP